MENIHLYATFLFLLLLYCLYDSFSTAIFAFLLSIYAIFVRFVVKILLFILEFVR